MAVHSMFYSVFTLNLIGIQNVSTRKERERLYRRYKAFGSSTDKLLWKRVRACPSETAVQADQTDGDAELSQSYET